MNQKSLEKLQDNEILRKRLAKFMTKFCFRNSALESFHDRISQDEMKEIMISMANNSLLFLSVLFATEKSNELITMLEKEDAIPEWDDPEIPDELLKSARKLQDFLDERRTV